MKKGNYTVDHFIPWSLYPADTGHNFVLVGAVCNSQKSNYLAAEHFLEQWMIRNQLHDQTIQLEISQLDFWRIFNVHIVL